MPSAAAAMYRTKPAIWTRAWMSQEKRPGTILMAMEPIGKTMTKAIVPRIPWTLRVCMASWMLKPTMLLKLPPPNPLPPLPLPKPLPTFGIP
ncbi:hypothetical protein CH063_13575 [Colletotrichum higginsianum]|uniref:Uncharacterized protein n=1 Tax=Colletotrichum higginsianum (strain IMI 349063) TaxID=759273 RepID=H1VUY8_COLHI|nr:hypothetical protein CH063_13575 [Colletotrichum higginsianum]